MAARVCVHDVFKATGLGVCVAGRVEGGTVSRGDELAMRPGDVTCLVRDSTSRNERGLAGDVACVVRVTGAVEMRGRDRTAE